MPGPVTAFAGPDIHANRPSTATGAVFYSCTTHGLIYRSSDGGVTWATWATVAGGSGGYVPGGTDVAVADGGTGASTAATARSNLGVSLVAVPFVIDGGGSVITTGVKGDIEVPFAWTDIASVRMFADQSGSIVVNVWKDSYANFPPVTGDKITASAPPTISSATKSEDTTLTGWTKTGSAGDTLRFNVDSATTITRVTLSIVLVR